MKKTEIDPSYALNKILGSSLNIASGIISLTIYAYIIGWIKIKIYFLLFKASWIISEITTATIVSSSITIVLPYLIFTTLNWLLFQKVPKYLIIPLLIAIVILILQSAGIFALELRNFAKEASNKGADVQSYTIYLKHIFRVFKWVCLVYLTSLLTVFAFIKMGTINRNVPSVLKVIALIILVFFLLPITSGYIDATRDKNPVTSSLPIVQIKTAPKETNVRLLFHKNDIFYAVKIIETDKFRSVLTIRPEQIYQVTNATYPNIREILKHLPNETTCEPPDEPPPA